MHVFMLIWAELNVYFTHLSLSRSFSFSSINAFTYNRALSSPCFNILTFCNNSALLMSLHRAPHLYVPPKKKNHIYHYAKESPKWSKRIHTYHRSGTLEILSTIPSYSSSSVIHLALVFCSLCNSKSRFEATVAHHKSRKAPGPGLHTRGFITTIFHFPSFKFLTT